MRAWVSVSVRVSVSKARARTRARDRARARGRGKVRDPLRGAQSGCDPRHKIEQGRCVADHEHGQNQSNNWHASAHLEA